MNRQTRASTADILELADSPTDDEVFGGLPADLPTPEDIGTEHAAYVARHFSHLRKTTRTMTLTAGA